MTEKKIKYQCQFCGFKGRLFRHYQTGCIELHCAQCVKKHRPDESDYIAGIGYLRGEGCELSGLVPAILAPCHTTCWGYSSVPQDQVVWWYDQPCNLLPAHWSLRYQETRTYANRNGPFEYEVWQNQHFTVKTNHPDDGGYRIHRNGLPYRGETVSTISELLSFMALNGGPDPDISIPEIF